MEKSKEYCIIGFDNLNNLKEEIASIATDNPDFVINKNIMISRFKTYLNPKNFNDIFNVGGKRSFFIFELNPLTSAVHIDYPEYQKLLFSNFDKRKELPTKAQDSFFGDRFPKLSMGFDIDNSIMDFFTTFNTQNMVNLGAVNNNEVKKEEEEYSEEIIVGYNKSQKDDLINKILSKGSDLTDSQ